MHISIAKLLINLPLKLGTYRLDHKIDSQDFCPFDMCCQKCDKVMSANLLTYVASQGGCTSMIDHPWWTCLTDGPAFTLSPVFLCHASHLQNVDKTWIEHSTFLNLFKFTSYRDLDRQITPLICNWWHKLGHMIDSFLPFVVCWQKYYKVMSSPH